MSQNCLKKKAVSKVPKLSFLEEFILYFELEHSRICGSFLSPQKDISSENRKSSFAEGPLILKILLVSKITYSSFAELIRQRHLCHLNSEP